MKLREYIENLNELVKDKPELLEVDVIYSVDDEGNSFNLVHNEVTPGYFYEDAFIPDGVFEEAAEDYEEGELIINSVCIN